MKDFARNKLIKIEIIWKSKHNHRLIGAITYPNYNCMERDGSYLNIQYCSYYFMEEQRGVDWMNVPRWFWVKPFSNKVPIDQTLYLPNSDFRILINIGKAVDKFETEMKSLELIARKNDSRR